MIKICHVVDVLNIGGLEKTVVQIVLNLREGYEHEVWCLKNKGVLASDIEGRGIKVREFNFRGGLNLFSLLRLVRAFKAENIDIVHSHGIFPADWGILAATLAGVPVRLVHCQNLYSGISRKEVVKFRFLSRSMTRVIAVSEAVRKYLIEFIGIDPRKIVVVYNSADAFMSASFKKEEIRRDLGLAKEDFVVGNISRLEEHKGQRFLLEAVAECRAKNINCKCMIAGDGPEKEKLRSRAQELNLNDAALFLGWRRDVQNLLSAMDVFIQPSLIVEGLPLALAEAASAGLPLIATDIGGNPEIVRDGINGFIIPPKDAVSLAQKIQFLMESPLESARMGENSKKIWEEKFSLSKMIEKIGMIYSDPKGLNEARR